MRKSISIVLALILLVSTMSSFAFASGEAMTAKDHAENPLSDSIDILNDNLISTRTTDIPRIKWNWNNGVYTGNFNIVQHTNTNYYFAGNSDGKIHYYISGTSTANKTCKVNTICKTCNSTIATYSFLPSETPSSRVVTLGGHSSHDIYFKIIAFEGGEFWSNNDFKGTIKVGTSAIYS